MTWNWSDQAHLQAGQNEIEDAMEGNLAGAFKQQAIADATQRQDEQPLWARGQRERSLLSRRAARQPDRQGATWGRPRLGFRGTLFLIAVVVILAAAMFSLH